MRNITSAFFVSLALLASSVNGFSVPYSRSTRGNALARRESSVKQNVTSRSLERRFDGARFTFYDAGLGACGKTNSGSDFIVALNAAQYAGGAHCFETITITVGSKTTSAQIVDECPGCPFGGLDFSRGLFDFFAPESVGVLTGSWNFGGGAAPAPSPSPTTHTQQHTTPAAPKTTAHSTPLPTLTSAGTTSFQQVAAAASASSDAARSASKTGSADSAAATVVAAPSVNNLQQMNLFMVQLGSLIMAGGVNGAGSS